MKYVGIQLDAFNTQVYVDVEDVTSLFDMNIIETYPKDDKSSGIVYLRGSAIIAVTEIPEKE